MLPRNFAVWVAMEEFTKSAAALLDGKSVVDVGSRLCFLFAASSLPFHAVLSAAVTWMVVSATWVS